MPSNRWPLCAVITTCKGRLAFLKRTLPAMTKTGFPVAVVDYDCPENTRGWVAANYPDVKVVRVDNQPLFHLSKARNIGAENTHSEMILFVDCDVVLPDACIEFLHRGAFPSGEFWAGGKTYDLTGTCLVPRSAFAEAGGYDEVIRGWGYQDIDLYKRLKARGLRQNRMFGGELLSAIPHDNALRVKFTGETDSLVYEASKIYSGIKLDIEKETRQQLPLAQREQLRKLVENVLDRSRAASRSVAFRVSFSQPGAGGGAAVFDRSYTVHPMAPGEVGLGGGPILGELD